MAANLRNWPGRISDADPHDIPPGAATVQDNCQSRVPGKLTVRKGMRPVTFSAQTERLTFGCPAPSSSSSSTTSLTTVAAGGDIIAMYALDLPESDYTIAEDATGTVRAGRDPDGDLAYRLSIKTGLNVFQPLSFARARSGDLIAVNGVDRGLRWNGKTAATQTLGITAPLVAPAIATPAGGYSSAGTYTCAYRYIDADGTPSCLSPLTTVTAAASDKFTWSAIQQPTDSRVTRIQLFRSTADQTSTAVQYVPAATLYRVTEFDATVGGTAATYTLDTYSDAQLQTVASQYIVPLLHPDGMLCANRFVPPPNNKAVCVFFQDRAFYGVGVRYTAGTISVTECSATITGSGTAWTAQMIGRKIWVEGAKKAYEISTFVGPTQMTLTETYADGNGTGLSYAIDPGPTERNQIYYSEVDEPESVPDSQNTLIIQENTGDDDEITALAPHGSYLYVLKERHVYRLSFVSQGSPDFAVHLIASVGCLNQRCWATLGDTLYFMGMTGVYAIGNGVERVSDPIQDLIRDGTVDFSKAKWFHARGDATEGVVRFYVAFAGDAGTRPTRALCYKPDADAWWTESYEWELGGTCLVDLDGRARILAGGEDGVIYLTSEGTADGITTAIRGTATASTNTTLVDSTATFTTAVEGCPVAIIAGTGKGQHRRITDSTGTQLTVDSAWTTNPDTTSVYLVGAIQWDFKSGLFEFFEDRDVMGREAPNRQRRVLLTYEPTTNDCSLDIKRFYNQLTTSTDTAIPPDQGLGVAGTTDPTVDMKLTRSNLSNSAGAAWIHYGGALKRGVLANRFVGVELTGYQGLDAVTVYALDVDGAGVD